MRHAAAGTALIAGYDALLCDLDGVVYEGAEAIPGAVEALNTAAERGIGVAFVTNNASRSPEAVAAHLVALGLNVEASQVFGSARAAAALLAEDAKARGLAQPSALVVGAKALADEVERIGADVLHVGDAPRALAADYVVQGFSPELAWKDLATAAFTVQAGATWIATNTDATLPLAEGKAPGNGTMVAAVRAATGVEPVVAGKPGPELMRLAARELGAGSPLVIGDRLDTDIAGGAAAGFDTALVLTGVHDAADAAAASTPPTHVIATLAALFAEPAESSDPVEHQVGTDVPS